MIIIIYQRCSKDQPSKLKEGDEIKFGTNASCVVVNYLPLIFCSSHMNHESKSQLKLLIAQIGKPIPPSFDQSRNPVIDLSLSLLFFSFTPIGRLIDIFYLFLLIRSYLYLYLYLYLSLSIYIFTFTQVAIQSVRKKSSPIW